MKDEQSSVMFILCPKCGRKMHNTYNARFVCEACGTVH